MQAAFGREFLLRPAALLAQATDGDGNGVYRTPALHRQQNAGMMGIALQGIASISLSSSDARNVRLEGRKCMWRLIKDFCIIVLWTCLFSAKSTAQNLLVNGDFEQGNEAFTTGYTFANQNTIEGQYTVDTNPNLFNSAGASFGDHTTGSGQMMLLNGSPAPDTIAWQETIPVAPNTNYVFSGWSTAWGDAGGAVDPSPAKLNLSINGASIGGEVGVSSEDGQWNHFAAPWQSGNATQAVIQISDTNTASYGNDFALDDLSFTSAPSTTTIGSPLIHRSLTDTNVGQVYIYNGATSPFPISGEITSWSFFDDQNPGNSVTPLIFQVGSNGSFTLTGVGATVTSSGDGLQSFPFNLIAGSNQVQGGQYTFGFTDRTYSVSYGQLVPGATNTGTISFDRDPSLNDTWVETAVGSVGGPVSLQMGTTVGNGGLPLYNQDPAGPGRTYSAQMTVAVPTPIATLSTNQAPAVSLLTLNRPTNAQLEVLNPATGQFVPSSGTIGTVGYIDPTKPTIVLTHGFASSPSMWAGTNGFAENLADYVAGANVLAWNWQGAAAGTIGAADSNAYPQGETLGNALSLALGTTYNQDIHFIGHSLGTLVNAEAINVFGTDDLQAKIQDTLLDEAEIANKFSSDSAPASPLPNPDTPNYPVFIDNYISAFGNVLNGAANVLLLNQPGNSPPNPNLIYISSVSGNQLSSLVNYFATLHSYPVSWYEATIANPSLSQAGYAWAIENGGVPSSGVPQSTSWYTQGTNPGDSQYTINAINSSQADAQLGPRNQEIAAVNPWIQNILLDAVGILASVQTENQVVVNSLPAFSTAGSTPELGTQFIFTKEPNPSLLMAQGQIGPTAMTEDQTAPTSSSYAWAPIAVPTNAKYLEFTYIFNGLSPNDFLSVGINDNLVFAMQSQYISDGVTNDSGLLDISQWAGQDVTLFLGLIASDDNNAGGTIEIDNIQFQRQFMLGDCNDDGIVDASDLAILEQNYGLTVTGGYADGDFNGDGVVNADDFSLFMMGLAEYQASVAAVPEPAAISLAACGMILAGRRRRN